MRSSVLLTTIREISDDTIHILTCRHKKIYSLELWLRVTVVCDRFNHCKTNMGIGHHGRETRPESKNIQVTFSSKISNCLSTEPSNFCECSSTTRIFHRPGGLTDLMASRNSITVPKVVQNAIVRQSEEAHCCEQLQSTRASLSHVKSLSLLSFGRSAACLLKVTSLCCCGYPRKC